ncbi:MAG: extracellular solute-binding protein [Spirochaetaceae bacterium]|jgi:microcin C transport system substrate-binding protein|nr:extracellular solute-binding protein [Spirochaetaceae bacterium]
MTRKMALVCVWAIFPLCAWGQPVLHARHLALRGEPVYKDGFTHFAYANPDAPKGGGITLYAIGTFDSFHRYALRGDCAAGHEYLYDTLMKPSDDEQDVLYPLVAESVDYAADYSYIIFNLNPAARDQDGEALTADDVVFSFQILFERGVPQFRSFYAGVSARALDARRVRFNLAGGGDKEKMLSIAQFTVFPRRYWQSPDGSALRDFSEPLVTPPLGTGPYRVEAYGMGQFVSLARVKNYWAADLPVNKGRYNFDVIRYDYYRDTNVAFEAFKAGEYDFRMENSAAAWATGYTGKAITSGRIIKEEIPNAVAQGMQSLAFNIERPQFADRRVRLALAYFFDFEWTNKNLFYGQYERTRSYFQNTPYSARGLPSPDELAELTALRAAVPEAAVPEDVFTREYNPPATDGTGAIRPQARQALELLRQAGWTLKNGTLVDSGGRPFTFELLIYDTATERFAIPFRANLDRYGIDMRIRMVDTSQFINRLRSRDFDMISRLAPAMYYPSSDLMILWHSAYIDSTWNTSGVRDRAVDYLCEQIAAAQEDPRRLLALGHAFDRILTWNAYGIPLWHKSAFRLAYANKFGRPKTMATYSIDLDSWWVKP